jgi:hypothetical protein
MTHNFRVLGLATIALATIALLAIGAAIAANAGAASFTAAKYPVVIKGSLEPGWGGRFTMGGTGVSCSEESWLAATNSATTDLTVSPSFAGCKEEVFGLSATVTTNSCTYTLTEPKLNKTSYLGNIDLVCPAGKVVEIHASTCTITVFPKNNLGSISYVNLLSSIELLNNVTGIEYQVDRGFLCPVASTYATKHTDGVYEGRIGLVGSTLEGTAVKIDIG